ncbi:PAS domain-containing protein [Acidisoma silvae]|nr:PAS domain-containing protein [Acidisoma silvae]
MSFVAADVIGRTLGISSAGYGVMTDDGQYFAMERDWTASGIASLPAKMKVEDYGSYYDQLRLGDAVAISDVRLDPRTIASASALESVSARSFINVPIIENGRLVALIYALSAEPRAWSAADIAFIRAVAERTHAAVERRRAERKVQNLAASLEKQVAERTRERDRIWQVNQDMLGVATPDGVWLSVNPAWTRTLGWLPDQIIGRTSEWLEHPEDREKSRPELQSMAGGSAVACERRFLATNGDFRLLSWTAVPLEGSVYCVLRDVTEERQREKDLRDANDFTRLALSAVGGVGVWTYDVAGDRFFCDAAIAALYGLNAEEAAAGMKRERFLANVHQDDKPKLRMTMAGNSLRGGDLELEYRIRHPDGSVHWVLSRGHTYFDDAGKATRQTGVGIETTSQRILEEQLRQAQKMEAVGQLTGGLAHDFNNLLAGILGSLELLRARLAQGRIKELDRYINAAEGASKRAASLTHRLLAFSRQQTLDPRPTNINRLVVGMEELIRRAIGPAIVMEPLIAAGGLWTTFVDAGQLENALLNLCINARDAMPTGGKLTLETGNRWLDVQAARERDLPPGQYVSLCVSDTGTGMTPDVIAKAFDPFFTTKPIGQGTGLGLSMIYGFARQSGGQVRIYSEVGAGTMVCIYLPRYTGEADREDSPIEFCDTPRAQFGETVLVIDDDPTVRMLVTEVLEDLGYVAIEASDGPTGLQILQSDVRIDLLVSDVGLPGGMNGRQVADLARIHRPELNILFITGYAENAVVSHGHLDRGMHILTKPFTVDGLANRIKDLIGAQ